MNLVTELENEIVYALLVEKKYSKPVNHDKILVLIDNIKAALQPLTVTKQARETNISVEKKANFSAH